MKVNVTAEDIAQLLASAPPRRVPMHVFKVASGVAAASWGLLVFGLVFGAMGLFFTALFFPRHLVEDWQLASTSAQTADGVITQVQDTNLSINKTKVVEYSFLYTPASGSQKTGRCYTTGEHWANGETVTVRYWPADPEVACIDGARLSEAGWSAIFVIIFPLLGGTVVAGWVLSRRNTRRLLRDGQVTEVEVVSVDQTGTKVNKLTVYRIVVVGPGLSGGQPVRLHRADKTEVNLALKRAGDRQPIFILFDPKRPKKILFPEAWVTPRA